MNIQILTHKFAFLLLQIWRCGIILMIENPYKKVVYPMKGRSFLKLLDLTNEEIGSLLDLAAELIMKKRMNIPHDELKGKNIALIFEKTSTRTRCSFEVAAHDLGMHVTYLDPSGSQIGKKECARLRA